jgi:hypothetical protein
MEISCGNSGESKTSVDYLIVPQVEIKHEGKWCPNCEEWKPYSEFHVARGRHDGVRAWCKICWNKKQRQVWRERYKVQKECDWWGF